MQEQEQPEPLLVLGQERPELPSAPVQQPAVVGAERQWFERARRHRGIELRKPFR
jgi:hypothetical protein